MGIYANNLRQEEKDRSLIIPISWNETEIREILDNRVNLLIRNLYSKQEIVKFADIFNFEVRGEKADSYIIKRTMLRPRDAIDFVNQCLSEGDGYTELNQEMVLKAEENYFSSRKKALVKEWVSLYPHIKEYIDCISFIENIEFTHGDDNQAVLNNIVDYLTQFNSRVDDERHTEIVCEFSELIRVWFVIGILGIKKHENLIIYANFDKPELDITDMGNAFIIHPLFYRANSSKVKQKSLEATA